MFDKYHFHITDCFRKPNSQIPFFEVYQIWNIHTSLLDKSDGYNEKYALAAQFKAGLDCGKVTTGVIEVLKKEIIFTGDVLNAAARIFFNQVWLLKNLILMTAINWNP